jgi:hypothetical protein
MAPPAKRANSQSGPRFAGFGRAATPTRQLTSRAGQPVTTTWLRRCLEGHLRDNDHVSKVPLKTFNAPKAPFKTSAMSRKCPSGHRGDTPIRHQRDPGSHPALKGAFKTPGHVLKGAFMSLGDLTAPFRTPAGRGDAVKGALTASAVPRKALSRHSTPVTRLSQHWACRERAFHSTTDGSRVRSVKGPRSGQRHRPWPARQPGAKRPRRPRSGHAQSRARSAKGPRSGRSTTGPNRRPRNRAEAGRQPAKHRLPAIPSTWRSPITPCQGPASAHRLPNRGPWHGVIARREVDGMAGSTNPCQNTTLPTQ